jgi:cyanophycinase-like exopeptidase
MNIRKIILCGFCLTASTLLYSQNYTSYRTGSNADTTTNPLGGVCLMGGATENDNAMRWFLEQARGGDVLVLRASGSDGYNDYFYTDLGRAIHSVESIVFHNASAAADTYILNRINQAEAIWFAGGDQSNYVNYWRGTAVDSLINIAVSQRNIVIGGTSAGMAILGGYYFSAQNGTVTSSTALANPFAAAVTVDSAAFLQIPYLADVITDTHYDSPDRKGRHITFLARIFTDYGVAARGIACDEYTAVCVDTSGLASIYGDSPNSDDNAYFIQTNCALTDVSPETCTANQPLHWQRGGSVLKVYAAQGTQFGVNTFDLRTWRDGSGGVWQDWNVSNGVNFAQTSSQPICGTINIDRSNTEGTLSNITAYPNPVKNTLFLSQFGTIRLLDAQGHLLYYTSNNNHLDMSSFAVGFYILSYQQSADTAPIHLKIIKE